MHGAHVNDTLEFILFISYFELMAACNYFSCLHKPILIVVFVYLRICMCEDYNITKGSAYRVTSTNIFNLWVSHERQGTCRAQLNTYDGNV